MKGPSVLRLDASLSPADGEAWYFPGARDHGSAEIVARVTRRDGTFWTACLDRALALTPSIDDIFVLPCGQRLFIAGGVVDRDDPTTWTALGEPGRVVVSRASDGTVVISDHSTVHVFGATGPLWTAQIGSDIGVSSVTPAEVVCDVYDVVTGQSVVRRFDRATGAPLPAA